MAPVIAVDPQLPAAVGAGAWSRQAAPRWQRKLSKENTETTSESPSPPKCAIGFAYPALAGCAVCGLAVFFRHVWCYTSRGWFGQGSSDYTASFTNHCFHGDPVRHRSVTLLVPCNSFPFGSCPMSTSFPSLVTRLSMKL